MFYTLHHRVNGIIPVMAHNLIFVPRDSADATETSARWDSTGDSVALPAKHICRALESKLNREGASALTPAEWHLLMVGRFLLAVESNTLADLLFNLSLPELFKVLDGLNAVSASTTANLWLDTLHRLAPVLGVEQPARDVDAIAAVVHELQFAYQANREADELCLLQFAFEQAESFKPP